MNFIQPWSDILSAYPGSQRILVFLIVFIFLLFAFSFFFAFYALLLRFINTRKAKKWQRLEDSWETLLLDILARDVAPEVLIKKVQPDEQLYFVDFIFRYAIQVAGSDRQLLARLAKPFTGVLKERLKTGDPEQKTRAILTLDRLQVANIGHLAVTLLDDPSPLVSIAAARVLCRPEYRAYAAEVVQHLHRYQSWSNNLLSSMLAAAGSYMLPHLRNTLQDEKQPIKVRVVIADALNTKNDFAAADVAAEVLQKAQNMELVAACLRLLSNMGLPKHRDVVRQYINAENFILKAYAVDALGTVGSPSDISTLLAAVYHPSNWVSFRAVQALKRMHQEVTLKDIAHSDHPKAAVAQQVLQGNA